MKFLVALSALLLVAIFQSTDGAYPNDEMNLELAEMEFHQALNEIYVRARFIQSNLDNTPQQKVCAIGVKDKAISLNIKNNISLNTCLNQVLEKNIQCKVDLVRSGTTEAKTLISEIAKCVAA